MTSLDNGKLTSKARVREECPRGCVYMRESVTSCELALKPPHVGIRSIRIPTALHFIRTRIGENQRRV